MHRLRAFLFLSLTLLAAPALAATLSVGPGQTYSTIQSAIVAANNGDTVLVYPGTYYENINFLGKAITVTSTPTPTGGAANTIIDGGRTAPAVTFKTSETRSSILSGFTIQNGGTVGNITGLYGSIYVYASSPTIVNNTITHSICWGIQSLGSPLIQNNEIDNTLDGSGIGFCSFGGGSAILLWEDLASNGAGNNIPPVVIGNLIQNNIHSGFEDAGGNGGAGVAAWVGIAVIENNIIRNNISGGQGAGIHLEGNGGLVVGNLVYNNISGGGGGGIDVNGFYNNFGVYPTFNAFIANNTFANNTYSQSYSDGISNDYAVDQIYFGSSGFIAPTFAFVNNIVAGNSPNPAVQCGWQGLGGANTLLLDHNLFFNAGGPIFTSLCTTNPIGTYGNISGDPLFVNPSANNYSLATGSPAIDAGNTSALAFLATNGVNLTTDAAGNPRLQDATGKGYPVIDIGALEVPGVDEQGATTLLLTPSVFQATAGSPLAFTVKAFSPLGIPTGSITLTEDMTNTVGTALLDSTGSSVFSVLGTPGIHHFVAQYPGQGVFTSAISIQIIVVISNYQPTITLVSSQNPSIVNQSVTFTVTAKSPDGVVPSPIALADSSTNTALATLTPNSSGVANYITSSLALGYHDIVASYAGDSTHNSADAYVDQDVITGYATSTALISSLNPSNFGQSVTFTATVASSNGTPTGSVVFADGGTTLQTVALTTGGIASFTTSALTVGTHPITATYLPTGSFAASSGNVSQIVNGLASTSVLTVSPSTTVYGGTPITLTATVSPATPPGAGTPTGSVTFIVDGVSGSPQTITAGTATQSLTGLAGGTHSFGCKYSGDTTYSPSVCNSASATITAAPTVLTVTSSLNPAPAFTPVTFTLLLTNNGVPVGAGYTVDFVSINGVSPPIVPLTTNASGIATYTVTSTTPGSYPVGATFAGNSNLASSSTNGLTEVITTIPTTTTLTASPNPGYQGQPVTITANVTSSASTTAPGTVVFFDAGNQIGSSTVDASGNATLTTSTLTLGSHPLTANFGPTFGSPFAASHSNTVNEVIAISSFNLTLAPSTISISAGKQGSTTLQLSSVGNFSGPLTLSFGLLPQYATGSISPSTVTLTSGGNTSAIFTLQTSTLAANTILIRPGSRTVPITLCTLLVLLPLALRRRSRMRSVLMLCAAAVLLQTLTGCTNIRIPFHFVAAGSYQVPITATDANNNTQTQTLTVVITP